MTVAEVREEELVQVESPIPGVAVVRLNRPASLNALSEALVEELRATLHRIADRRDVRAVVLTGAGRGFCSGHELSELGDVTSSVDVARVMDNQVAYSSLVTCVNELPQPVIAAVNGPAAGGGLALALAADTRVCSVSARFNVAPVRLGIAGSDVGISYLLPRIVGPTLAFEMMLTGRLVEADEALRSGLVLRVTPDADLLGAALAIADEIAANSPFAVATTKRLMWAHLDAPSLRHAIDAEDRSQVLSVLTGDARIAIPAFRERRRPDWGS